MWKRIKKWFGGDGKDRTPRDAAEVTMPSGSPVDGKIAWLEDADSPFGVPVIDLRPFALTMLSASKDQKMAENAMSYGGEDGTAFVGQPTPSSRVTDCALRFPIDRVLLEGALFQPEAMEDKWALYLRGGRILCIRSWLRRVQVSAAVRVEGEHAVVGPITGSFDDEEPPELTVQKLEFLLRSHALGEPVPAPLSFAPLDLPSLAVAMFGIWGRRALYATHHPLPASSPVQPLRTNSLLHIAVARGDRDGVEQQLAQGAPWDVLARDGLGLPHWALGSADTGMLAWLLDRGCPVDARSDEGATPLMLATQRRSLERVRLLVDRGADVNAQDARGFTSLHRAAEMGEPEIARFLLEHGATVDVEARGMTPLALAELRKEAEVIALLKAHAPT